MDGGEKTGKKTYFVQEDERYGRFGGRRLRFGRRGRGYRRVVGSNFDLLLDEDEDLSIDSNLDLDLGFEDDDEYDLSDDDFSDEDDEF